MTERPESNIDPLILVVDDEPSQRFLSVITLKRLGYKVEEATNGHEAVRCFAEASKGGDASPFDLIIMDMIMEDDFDGLKAYEKIQEFYPDQKVIIASGHAEDGRAKAAQNLGAAWLAKPYERAELTRAVRGQLGLS